MSTIMTTVIGQSIGILQSMRIQQAAGLNGNRYATFHQLGKEQAQKTLEAAGLAPSVRAEALSLADFVRLYGILCEPDVANGKFVV